MRAQLLLRRPVHDSRSIDGPVGPIMIRVVGRARREWWWIGALGIAAVAAGVATYRRHRKASTRPLTLGEVDWSGPDEYERLTGISKESYEWRLLVAAQSLMMGEWTITSEDEPAYTRQGVLDRGSVDDVRLEGDGVDAALVVLFRSDDHPGCVFGWHYPIWPAQSPNPEDPDTTPEGWAGILALELREILDLDIPEFPDVRPGHSSCDPHAQGITWVRN